jgi:predicted DNA-binding protein (MmcQ/YjbR family)
MPKQTSTKLSGALGETALAKLRAICAVLPNSRETMTWGSPHFRIDDKIFCGIGDEKGRLTIGFKLEMDHAHALVQDERFWPSPYVGRHGWVTTEVTPKTSWRQIKAFVEESYGLIAPKPKSLRSPKSSAKRKR